MSISDVVLQNFMPRSILESDDDLDTWSSGGRSSGSSQCSETGSYSSAKELRDPNDFRLFTDYFGLSNLLNNIKISEDNPLLHGSKNIFNNMQRARRISWESDSSDSGVVLSPTMDNPPCTYERSFESNGINVNVMNNNNIGTGVKQLPPPSMRLSKAERDHIISGAWQQNINNRQPIDKMPPPPPPSINGTQLPPPTSPRQPVVVPPPPSSVAPPPARPQSGLHVCVFCRNNGESESVYTSHVLKDSDGRTSCPILRAYTCPICKANGDTSHTIKYCPMNQNARVPSSIGGVMGPPQPPHAHPHPQHTQQSLNMGPPQRSYQPQRPANFRPPPFPANLAAAGRINPPTVKLRQ
uniref:Nanos-2 n=1 Tax=Nanomia bijuga TaxID=168759 RepID=W6A355_NANBJ|nr:nanos-2 [Nanomia bijuga]